MQTLQRTSQRVQPRLQIGVSWLFQSSLKRFNSAQASLPQPKNETENVSALDKLLTTLRASCNSAHFMTLPLRNPRSWSQTLLRSSNPASIVEDSTSFPGAGRYPSEPETAMPRTMQDSYSELVLPVGSSPELFEEYTNAAGGIRMGKLMEHFDSLAGSIAYKHMLGPDVPTLGTIDERGFYIVTASVDRLDMLQSLDPKKDLRLSGQVIYTGFSSMEVAVKMESIQRDGSSSGTVLIGRFSMVCRDAKTNKAKKVNPLIAESAEEKALFTMGQNLKERRQLLALKSLTLVPPSSEEAKALHDTHLQFGLKQNAFDGVERVWMGQTRKESTMIMFPQERNVHQKIFGGYLMRLAYELGFANTCVFTKSHVHFLSLDGISFAKPVPIGCLLCLTSHILYSKDDTGEVHVGVQANIIDVETGSQHTTNDFRFTWRRDGDSGLQRRVVPRTYNEAMLWLEGRRALEASAEMRGLRAYG